MRKDWERGIMVIGIVLLLLPVIIRSLHDQPLVPGAEGYGHARIAALIAQQDFPERDPAMPERLLQFDLFDALLAGFARLFGISAAVIILPFLLGLVTMLCLVLAVRRWKLPPALALSTELVFVLSPLFADAFTQPVPRGLELLLWMLFLLILAPVNQQITTQRALRGAGALVLGAAIATFGILPAAAAFAMPLLLRTVQRRVPAETMGASLAALVVLVTVALPAFLQTVTPSFARPVPVVLAIADFSGAAGLSLFAWLLALIGLVLLWRFKRKYYLAMIAASALLMVVLIAPSALVIGHVLVAFLAGSALASLAAMRWAFGDIRMLTLLVLVCGLLFSTLAHAMALAQGPPTKDIQGAALAAKALLPQDAVILTHADDGFWFAFWSGRQVFLDGWLRQTPRVEERWAAAEAVWHAQDIGRVRPVLFRNSIDAVVVTEEMRAGKVWELPEQDLLFLVRNNETFKNVHRSSSVDIWAVLRPATP